MLKYIQEMQNKYSLGHEQMEKDHIWLCMIVMIMF